MDGRSIASRVNRLMKRLDEQHLVVGLLNEDGTITLEDTGETITLAQWDALCAQRAPDVAAYVREEVVDSEAPVG